MRLFKSKISIIVTVAALSAVGFTQAQTQQEPDKSHPHLQQQYCFDCHQCEEPTKSTPCLKKCPYSKIKGDSADMPSGNIPGTVMISSLVNLYGPVQFEHQLHADMSTLYGDCSQCHHYSETDDYPRCQQCHGLAKASISSKQPGLKGAYHRQCMDCHIEWSGDNGCNFCHLPVGDETGTKNALVTPPKSSGVHVEPAIVLNTNYEAGPVVTFRHQEHAANFGLSCSNCHAGSSCATCHAGKQIAATITNRTESCFSCHADQNCGLCHSTQIQEKSFHYSGTNWQLNASHEELSCDACHGPPEAFAVPTATCSSCHGAWDTSNFEHAVTGLVLSSDHEDIDCENCHFNEKYDAVPTCTECHDEDFTYPELEPGARISN